jgi:hypothetical protein
MTGEIPFREEIGIEGISEDMEAFTDIFIDYIDADRVPRKHLFNFSDYIT